MELFFILAGTAILLAVIIFIKKDNANITNQQAKHKAHEASHNNCSCPIAWKKGTPYSNKEWEWTMYCSECGNNLFYTDINEQGLIYGNMVCNPEYVFNPTPEGAKKYRALIEKKFVHATIPNPQYQLIARQRALQEKQDAEAQKAARLRIDAALAETTRYAYQNLPKCPNCRSTNIAPIGTIKRIASVELMGLASPTIGKSYECKSCGYKW